MSVFWRRLLGCLLVAGASPVSADQGEGFVFDPNPVVASGDRTLREGDDVDPWRVAVVLHDLDGSGYLHGAWARIENPAGKAFQLDLRYFYASRSLHFEEVMAYHHITESQRYLQSLGFTDLNARAQRAVVHATGLNGSWYDPRDRTIRFGDGGVDDAEDADVILHEYGHALFHAAVGDHATPVLSEGFADYWAATRTGDPRVGDWDGAYRAAGCLRDLSEHRRYPIDVTGEPHADGMIWGGLLWSIRERLTAPVADRLILTALRTQCPRGTLPDAAAGLLAAATDPASRRLVEDALGEWGFLPRRGAFTLSAAAGSPAPEIPLGFAFVPPGMREARGSDALRAHADGRLTLPPRAALIPLAPHPCDSLRVVWETTWWETTVEQTFWREGHILRRVTTRLRAEGGIEIEWHHDGSRRPAAGVSGWFPEGLAGPSHLIELPGDDELHAAADQALTLAHDGLPFPLAGAIWRIVPDKSAGYAALMVRGPSPPGRTATGRLLPSPTMVGRGDDLCFGIPARGTYRIEVLDCSGRCLSRLNLGVIESGMHALDSALLFDRPGVHFLRLRGPGQTLVGRVLFLR